MVKMSVAATVPRELELEHQLVLPDGLLADPADLARARSSPRSLRRSGGEPPGSNRGARFGPQSGDFALFQFVAAIARGQGALVVRFTWRKTPAAARRIARTGGESPR